MQALKFGGGRAVHTHTHTHRVYHSRGESISFPGRPLRGLRPIFEREREREKGGGGLHVRACVYMYTLVYPYDTGLLLAFVCTCMHVLVHECFLELVKRAIVVFLSCPLVKKHADLSGSFLYSQSTMKNMYSKPTNRTKLSIPMKTKSIA